MRVQNTTTIVTYLCHDKNRIIINLLFVFILLLSTIPVSLSYVTTRTSLTTYCNNNHRHHQQHQFHPHTPQINNNNYNKRNYNRYLTNPFTRVSSFQKNSPTTKLYFIQQQQQQQQQQQPMQKESDSLLPKKGTSSSSCASRNTNHDHDTIDDNNKDYNTTTTSGTEQQDDFYENHSNSTTTTIGRTILNLAIPAGAALLIDPFMTLVDTAFVGRFYDPTTISSSSSSFTNRLMESTMTTTITTPTSTDPMIVSLSDPLAGMGSASALLAFFFYLCNFLCTATTPLVSQQRASGNIQQAIQTSGQALTLSFVLGILIILILNIWGPYLLNHVMGTSYTGYYANEYANQYLLIRSFAAPAVLCIEASTGILRGYLDTRTPIYILVTANILNLLFDIILIIYYQLGPLGAAIATTTAEWVSAILFLCVLAGWLPSGTKQGEIGSNQKQRNNNNNKNTLTTLPTALRQNNNNKYNNNNQLENMEGNNQDRDITGISSRGITAIVPLATIPSWNDVRPLIVASSSIFFRSLVLQLSLAGAAAMAARSSSSTSYVGDDAIITSDAMAAHQIGIQLWLICSFFCDSLAAASQGLIADAIGRQNTERVRSITKTVFLYSIYLGIFLAIILQLGLSSEFIVENFTRDPNTQRTLAKLLPYIIIAQPLNSIVFAMDGILQGGSQFPYQAGAMILSGIIALSTFVVLEILLVVPTTENIPMEAVSSLFDFSGMNISFGSSETLFHVWTALLMLQFMRGVTSLWKIIDKNGPINLLGK